MHAATAGRKEMYSLDSRTVQLYNWAAANGSNQVIPDEGVLGGQQKILGHAYGVLEMAQKANKELTNSMHMRLHEKYRQRPE